MRSLNNKGFMLADIMVAVMITTVALMAVGGLIWMSTGSFRMNAMRTDAFKLAQAQMEAYKSVPSAEWNTLVTSTTYSKIATTRTLTNVPAAFTLETWARKEADVNGVTSSRLVQVRVNVQWVEKTPANVSQTSQVELITLFERDP